MTRTTKQKLERIVHAVLSSADARLNHELLRHPFEPDFKPAIETSYLGDSAIEIMVPYPANIFRSSEDEVLIQMSTVEGARVYYGLTVDNREARIRVFTSIVNFDDKSVFQRGQALIPFTARQWPSVAAVLDSSDPMRFVAHYHSPYGHWYVAGFDWRTGLAFGWVCLNDLQNAEYGSFDLWEMSKWSYDAFWPIERELFFQPDLASKVLFEQFGIGVTA